MGVQRLRFLAGMTVKDAVRLVVLVFMAAACAGCGSAVSASGGSPAPFCPTAQSGGSDRFDRQLSLVSTPSGVQYGDIRPGCGALAVVGKTASVHFTGWLGNGQAFGSSRQGGGPLCFTLGSGRPVPGFNYGFTNLRVGGQRRLVIPPSLAYGPQGFPPVIPPNATLIVDVQLVAVGATDTCQQAPAGA